MIWKAEFENIEVSKVAGLQRSTSFLKDTPEVTVANEAFELVLKESDLLSTTLVSLERIKARYCIFGGWLRDTLASRVQGTPPPRDVDIVVADVDLEMLVKLLPADVQPTMFGGVQSSAPPIPFDLWPLHETFLIRTLKLPSSFDSLLLTADFNINAAVYFPRQREHLATIIDAGMLSALESKQIEFNASELPFPVLQCARLTAYAAKLGFKFAPSVIEFLRSILENPKNQIEVVSGLERYHRGHIAKKAIAIVTSIVEGDI